MKRIIPLLLLVLLITGCSGGNSQMDRAMELRSQLQKSTGCSFESVITADYGDKIYTFAMECRTDQAGNLSFTVTEPESISGISGTVSEDGGKLTFDDVALAFELLADDQVTPVSAPWILIHTLRGGYLTACGEENGILRLSIDDSYEDDALHLDVWLDEGDLPARGEILWDGRRILSVEVRNFEYL
ncbi:MAG: hypothetical protein IJX67_09510 [Oscillospiraceae bacterium]|nr:hypothetical protein [Oscillospiraceae bacterium]